MGDKLDSNEYTGEVIKNMPIGIAISNEIGLIINANDKFLDMFGYISSEIYSMSMDMILHDFKHIKNRLQIEDKIENKEVYINSRKNKLRFTLSVYYINKQDEEKEILYLFTDAKRERKLANRIIENCAIYNFDKIIYKSKKMERIIGFAKKIADSKSTVLITGESGTGKEVFAQSIHNISSRREMPFIAINAAAIPRNLIESELFGYEGGAFTGAKRGGHPGKFEIADKGTIFLDEIGEMPLELQTRLLRVLEEGIVSRVGSVEQNYVNVRIIAASNKDLKREVTLGNFREDLFYRLNVLPLRLIPLRERKEDIEPLINYFMETLSKRLNKRKVKITKGEMEILLKYDWPGNVRELENLVELTINLEIFPYEVFKNYKLDKNKQQKEIEITSIDEDKYSLNEIEKNHILYMLKKNDGNISLTARKLGISRNTLYRKMEKFNLE